MLTMIDRRKLATLLLAAAASLPSWQQALADKGKGGGSSGGGHSGSGGGDDHSGSGSGDDHSGPGGGGDDSDRDKESRPADDDGQQRARNAARTGKAVPLRELLSIVKRSYPGDVLDVKFQTRGGAMTYRVVILGRNGRMTRVRIDAQSKRILSPTAP